MSQHPVFVSGPDTGAVNTRRLHRQRLLESIRQFGPISRADLAKRTRLSPPTVSALVEELVGETGLLREIGIGASKGGRPPLLLEFNAEFGCLVGVDLGFTVVRFALADLQGRVVARHEARTRAHSCDETIHQLLEGIDTVVRGAGRDPRKLFAIGIGTPGAADMTAARVSDRPTLAGWNDVPLADRVQARFRAPVQIDNHANMAALGERWRGAAKDATDFVFVGLGAGVDAGVVLGGRLHRGQQSFAGGIGRLTLDYREWEVDHGPAGYLGSRVKTVNGAITEELAVLVGAAVANIVAILDPGLVIFGGVSGPAAGDFLGRVREVVSRIVPPAPALELSALGDEAAVFGSVYAAMEVAEAHLLAIAGSPGGLSGGVKRARSRRSPETP
ncbi:MAG TPA: ROK family transcriptional regulator [Vicinamibacterales bacterium]|nr:ROK family transcriptional regulator [Vicinamibacterales bacterium]